MAKTFGKNKGASERTNKRKLPEWVEKVRDRVRDGASKRGARASRASYGPPLALGAFGRVRAVPGQQAAVVEMRPGMYVVTFIPQGAAEMGFAPLLAPAIVRTVRKVFRTREERQQEAAQQAQAQQVQAQPVPHGQRFLPVRREHGGEVGVAVPESALPDHWRYQQHAKRLDLPFKPREVGVAVPEYAITPAYMAQNAGQGAGQGAGQAAQGAGQAGRPGRGGRLKQLVERVRTMEIPWLDQETAGELGLGCDDGPCRCGRGE